MITSEVIAVFDAIGTRILQYKYLHTFYFCNCIHFKILSDASNSISPKRNAIGVAADLTAKSIAGHTVSWLSEDSPSLISLLLLVS